MTKVLYIDDDPDIRKIVHVALQLVGQMELILCEKTSVAIETLATMQTRSEVLPDLILLDVMMPETDGPASLAIFRNNPTTAHIPVVFFTARASSTDVENLIKLGATGVIAKPFDPMALAAKVRTFIA